MERYICIHCHFYQPPRENPWLEAIEQQDSAYPYHDWNERITAECYGPNAASRILDAEGRILQIVNNYSKISFNFGPTLLSWMEEKTPEVYAAILEADRESMRRFGGHGSAIAQAYNHMIVPLSNENDQRSQVLWGIRDFEKRFGRYPEGMWLPETAANTQSLEILAEYGIKFTILAPHQAGRIRRIGTEEWQDVGNGSVDPTRAYVQKLPSGKQIALFFYDGPISRGVAFEKLLASGEKFSSRLLGAFHDQRDWPQMVHIATDGETYGHHHTFGDMALAYALHHIETNNLARITNYGEYLEKNPPEWEAEIIDNTSWSCAHGVERWRSNCGCNSGREGWNQEWRGPLRNALNWLRDELAPIYEDRARGLLKDPWAARNEYINVVLDRSPENLDSFFHLWAARELSPEERTTALKLLEMQRHAMLMYTSCGWFFDELSGIETVQVIMYAGRAIHLAREFGGAHIEAEFVRRLSEAKSNLPEHGDGGRIYEKWVKPANVDLLNVGAHYAISSLFERYGEDLSVYCYDVTPHDYQAQEFGRSRLALGHAEICSRVTQEKAELSFGVLHLGDHNISAGVRHFKGAADYQQLVDDAKKAFLGSELPEVIRILDRHFEGVTYSLKSIFKEEQRKTVNMILDSTLAEVESSYRALYDHHAPLMRFLGDMGMPLPPVLKLTAEFVINASLRHELESEALDLERIQTLMEAAEREAITLDRPGLAFALQKNIDHMAERFEQEPENTDLLNNLTTAVNLLHAVKFELSFWKAQNIYYRIYKKVYPQMQQAAEHEGNGAQRWVELFTSLGRGLSVSVAPNGNGRAEPHVAA